MDTDHTAPAELPPADLLEAFEWHAYSAAQPVDRAAILAVERSLKQWTLITPNLKRCPPQT
jgi:hypothetical protein